MAITDILERATKASLEIEEEKETSDQVFAKIDAERISKFLEYLLNLFVRDTPEMRLQQLQSASHDDLQQRVHVEPMATEAKDFLNISVDRDLTKNLKYEFFKQDIENQRIDLRFFYLTPGSADLWFKIINFSDYKFNEYGRENIKRNASDLINVILEKSVPSTDHVDLVDLGVRAAVKDYYLLKPLLEKMPRNSNRMNYVPLDYSITILQRVMDYMDELMETYPNKLHIEGILGNFYRLVRYNNRINELSKSPKVFALLGNILGNVDEARILNAITSTMNPNDLFLLEIDLIDNRTDDKLKAGSHKDIQI
ncbi:MAG: L-histidine N(alpha)-methyltransferase [Nitrososphaeraceae archaeon]|nr:L-histidine N(alpha)-methyltransferase [Nitrososphaeraceae archaeon]